MKKKMAIVLILVLVFSNSMVVFGAENSKKRTAKSNGGNTWTYWDESGNEDNGTNKNQQEVTASYSTVIYNVDISWGNMQYTYSKANTTWDPGTHTYGTGTGSWSVTNLGIDDAVTVGNHSNAKIYATFNCSFESTYSNLQGQFITIDAQNSSDNIAWVSSDKTLKLEVQSAVNRGTTFTSKDKGLPQGMVRFEIDGDPGIALTNTKIGTITVTISG